ncbi:hypothetical protein [Palleronia sp.]|uniref:hypothetical protein n=1 Tax=Palleronia sp. TaxID=1940284 RepID=UPI0035C82E16
MATAFWTRLGSRVCCVTALTLSLVAVQATAGSSCWDMDGATLRLSVEGADRVLRYQGPPSVLVDLGIERGALLFRGRETDGALQGTAHAISPPCPEAEVTYPVEGQVHASRNRITLRGLRPLLSACRPDGSVAAETLVLVRKLGC